MKKTVLLFMMGLMMVEATAEAAPVRLWRRLWQRRHPKEIQQLLRRDRMRDRWLPVRILKKPRTVFRYTTRTRAEQEMQKGLSAGTHLTARGGSGRPPSSRTAQRRYGLPRNPEVRETIRLPAGTRIRQGKVLGGDPGVGEIVLAQPLEARHVQKVIPLKKPRSRSN